MLFVSSIVTPFFICSWFILILNNLVSISSCALSFTPGYGRIIRDEKGDFLTNGVDPKEGGHFILPVSVAQTLASLPAGQYYFAKIYHVVSVVAGCAFSYGIYTEVESKGAVLFTIAPAKNVWSDTITASDWAYSEFELGRHIHIGTTKYETQLKYAANALDPYCAI